MVAQIAQRSGRPQSGVLPPINTELEHRGKRYHVQTEDLGHRASSILTETFCAGRVLASKKVPYPPVANPIDLPHRVLELMRQGHKAALKAILHEEAPTPPIAFTPTPPRDDQMTRIITGRWDRSSAHPEMRVFLLSPAPVTNAEYEKYLQESGISPSLAWNPSRPGNEPIVGLTMPEARAYAAWKGCRLPRASELAAARQLGALAQTARDLWEWTEVDAGVEPPNLDHAWTIFRVARNTDPV
jgi:hypothetical protein